MTSKFESATLLIMRQVFWLLLKAFDTLAQKLTNLRYCKNFKNQSSFTGNFKPYIKGGAPHYYVEFNAKTNARS